MNKHEILEFISKNPMGCLGTTEPATFIEL
jgi:hypothetical protein